MLGKTRILIIDDEVDLLDILKFECEEADCYVETTPSGVTALQKLLTSQFDYVICDVHIPDLDGLSIYKKVSERVPHPPEFIFITGEPDFENIFKNTSARAEVLVKPFNAQKMVKLINQTTRAFPLSKC